MKKLLKKLLVIASATVLVIALAGLATSSAMAWSEIRALRSEKDSQLTAIDKLKLDVQALSISNGTSLDQCLDKAAKQYGNDIKLGSTVADVNGNTTYTQGYDKYKAIEAKLNSDRQACNDKYN